MSRYSGINAGATPAEECTGPGSVAHRLLERVDVVALDQKYARTLLTVGPRHSGKSVLAYLLFKYLRQSKKNDAALMDLDIFAPTFRPHKLASADEEPHIYVTPNYGKLTDDVPCAMFENLVDYNFRAVRERGVIIMDGPGRHSDKTEALLERANSVLIVCKSDLSELEMIQANYQFADGLKHPFDLYSSRKTRAIEVTTHLGAVPCTVDIQQLKAELSGLDREGIVLGEVKSIPFETCEAVREIANHISGWF